MTAGEQTLEPEQTCLVWEGLRSLFRGYWRKVFRQTLARLIRRKFERIDLALRKFVGADGSGDELNLEGHIESAPPNSWSRF